MKMFGRGSQAVALAVLAGLYAVNACAAEPCFTASGNTITVMNLPAKNGAPHEIDVEHLPGVSSMVSSGPIAHNIQINNIKRDAAKNVTGFDATIDDKPYQFPKNACSK